MKLKSLIAALVVLLSVSWIHADELEDLQQRLNQIKRQYSQKQAQLQQTIETRWEQRQNQVDKKKELSDRSDALRQEIERLYADVARAREGQLARENALTTEKDLLSEKQSQWEFIGLAVHDKYEKEKKKNLGSFPVDQDVRMENLNTIENRFPSGTKPLEKFQAISDYLLGVLHKSTSFGITRRSFIVGSSRSASGQVLRVGYSLAWAMGPDASAYMLNHTGVLGANAWQWVQLSPGDLATSITTTIPKVLQSKKIQSTMPVDIIQNQYSNALLAGAKPNTTTRFKLFLAAGGPILYPMAIIVLWALFIVVNRMIRYSSEHKRDNRFFDDLLVLLQNGKMAEAKKKAEQSSCALGRVSASIMKKVHTNRQAAEKAVREHLLGEIPRIDKYLDTLAVLAGAAPLLGLLGTVTGMISMFEAITKFGTADPKLLAGGISEALITTQVGLAIAIPLLLLHNYLSNRRNKISSELELRAMQVLNTVWPE